MKVLHHIDALRSQVTAWRRSGERIAFVPTMGNLHRGHFELVKQARKHAQHVVASIFVNPLQFGPQEDFSVYPRTLEADQHGLEQVGTDLLFAPNGDELYPYGPTAQTQVEVPELSNILCGASRPGHFIGVATVVCKLLNIVQPDIALFGEKDFQQLLVIKRMAIDLNLPVEIVGIPIVREADGLALSSRNGYLTAEERRKAPALYQVLQAVVQKLRQGATKTQAETQACLELEVAGLRPDYVSISRTVDLAKSGPDDRVLVILAAAYLGRVRLIDNLKVL